MQPTVSLYDLSLASLCCPDNVTALCRVASIYDSKKSVCKNASSRRGLLVLGTQWVHNAMQSCESTRPRCSGLLQEDADSGAWHLAV
jgi:hypothetical protein